MIDDLAKIRDNDDVPSQVILAYWFFQYNNKNTTDLRPFLRSLLKQLVASQDKGFPQHIREWLGRVKHQNSLLDRDKLFKMVQDVIQDLYGDVFIILDGLEKFPQHSTEAHHLVRGDVLNLICQLIQGGKPNLHVLLASRMEKDIEAKLLGTQLVDSMDAKEVLELEVDAFITRTLGDSNFKTKFSDTLSEISQKLDSGERRYFPTHQVHNMLDLCHPLMSLQLSMGYLAAGRSA